MTNDKNLFYETGEALAAASKLLARLCSGRKASAKLPEITLLMGQVARLTRAINQGTEQSDRQDDGYGDKNHYNKISVPRDTSGLIR